jgi:diacylglycerol kinase family enzyme
VTPAAFVINPARVRDARRLIVSCRAVAAARGVQSSFLLTSVDDHGSGLAREAVRAGARVVFAVGGDGTVRACADALAGTDVALAIVPRGTANLAARALGVPSGLAAALAVGFGEHERRIDLADADGMTFAAMAGIGLDAAVVGATSALLKRGGWPAYAMTGVRHLIGRPVSFTVRLDGGELLSRQARCVVVGNVGLLPGGFVLLPGARPDDGLLDVGILAPSSLAGWARVGYRVVASSSRDDHELEQYQARRVEIRVGDTLPRQVDGEIIDPGRSLTVAVRRGALLVRVPGGTARGR